MANKRSIVVGNVELLSASPARPAQTLCELVTANAKGYWGTSPDLRTAAFAWLENHVLECDGCALALENVLEQDKSRNA